MEQDTPGSLLAEAESLKVAFVLAARQLRAVATELDHGTCPSKEATYSIEFIVSGFSSLFQRASLIVHTDPTPHRGVKDDAPSLDQLMDRLRKLVLSPGLSAESALRKQSALAILGKVETLQHSSGVFDPLKVAQGKASALRSQLAAWTSGLLSTELEAEIADLLAGQHPLAALVELAANAENIQEETGSSLHTVVAGAFGPSLAFAATAHKLSIRSEVEKTDKTDNGTSSLSVDSACSPTTKTDPVLPPGAQAVQPANTESIFRSNTPNELPVGWSPQSEQPLVSTEQSESEVEGHIEVNDRDTETEKQAEEQAVPKTQLANDLPIRELRVLPNDTKELAQLVLNTGFDREVIELIIASLVAKNKVALAHHCAVFLQHRVGDSTWAPALLRACALAPHVWQSTNIHADLLKDDLACIAGEFTGLTGVVTKRRWTLLMIAATLRPALLAPSSNAGAVLRSLHVPGEFQALSQWWFKVVEFAKEFRPIDPSALSSVMSESQCEDAKLQLRQRVETWMTQAPAMNIPYPPARRIWRTWLVPGGWVHALLTPIRQGSTARLAEMKTLIDRYSNDQTVREEVNSAHRTRGIGPNIAGNSFSAICKHAHEALQFATAWINLEESSPNRSKDRHSLMVQQLREHLLSTEASVLKELGRAGDEASDVGDRAAILCCGRACQNVAELLRGTTEPTVPMPIREILNSDLLHLCGVTLNSEWQLQVENEQSWVHAGNVLLTFIANPNNSDWKHSIDAHIADFDMEAVERVLAYLRDSGEVLEATLDNWEEESRQQLGRCRELLKRKIQVTRRAVARAVGFSLLRERDRERYVNEVDWWEQSLDRVLRFNPALQALTAIEDELNNQQKLEIEAVRSSIMQAGIVPGHVAYERIYEVLEKGDIGTAREYMDLIEAGETLPESGTRRDTFVEFFPEKVRLLEDSLDRAPILPDNIRRGRGIPGVLEMKEVAGAQAQVAADMVASWLTLKRTESATMEHLSIVFAGLGFRGIDLTSVTEKHRVVFDMRTYPVRNRDLCPVPEYGSDAQGHYRVLCLWGRPTPDDIVDAVQEIRGTTPIFVLYFGRLTDAKRREVSWRCRENLSSFVLLDETLLVYLCGERGSRMPVLYQCALPFSWLNPYTTTASLVPTEMFYGRRAEAKSIIDRMGSCFMYGGRQLGKTALLRAVEREFHAPDSGQIAIWADLKAQGIIGDAIWELVARLLRDHKVISVPPHSSRDKIIKEIYQWLDKDHRRRILLLLDEADRFLEADGRDTSSGRREGFSRTAELKNLMEETNRRFKVVFAGLHNVQRTTRAENNPLAHYGRAMCIGPLLEYGGRDARALVEQPLLAIGYRISADLVTRILMQTNYYPSLIQLYCHHLIEYLGQRRNARLDPSKTPPFEITETHIEEVYHDSSALRDEIRKRFMLTLDLDNRYKVIAFAIALFSQGAEQQTREGFNVAWIRDNVSAFWPAGFEGSSSEEDMRSLLDEMVGLGVLRKLDSGNFCLRTPNLLTLLGTELEIWEVLDRCCKEQRPPLYDAATFRRQHHTDPSRRSPLTAQQEAELRGQENSVSIVFGCNAAGLFDVPEFLGQSFSEEFFIADDYAALDLNGFTRRLAGLKGREKNGTTAMVVSADAPWTLSWIEAAAAWRDKRPVNTTAFVSIIFLADPHMTWQLLLETSDLQGWCSRRSIRTISLRPWHEFALWQWATDCNLVDVTQQQLSELTTQTGNWPILLGRIVRQSNWRERLAKLNDMLCCPQATNDLVPSFGLDISESRTVFCVLEQCGEPVSPDWLVELGTGFPLDVARRAVRWGDLLSLLRSRGEDRWQLDPIVERLVRVLK